VQAVCKPEIRHILVALTALFAVRVTAQFVSLFITYEWFPAFDRWSSGVISYPLLLVTQLLILALMLAGCAYRGQWNPGPATVWITRRLAQLYFLIMFLRLMVSISGVSSSHWWQMTLPALFHLVLASYLYCIAEFNGEPRKKEEISDEHIK